jgi:hypothetical protein
VILGDLPLRARVVDWSLLILTLVGIVTGLWSFLVGDPGGRWLFVAHGALGLAILGVLVAKVRRVTPIVAARKGRRLSALIGIATALVALVTVGIGVWWVMAQRPVDYPNGMILHTVAAFVLLGLCLWHLILRYRPLRQRDVRDRRSLLWLGVVLLGGGVLWGGVEGTLRALDAPGRRRRFTGSRAATSTLPVTMWMFDPLPEIDRAVYQLDVSGMVAAPMRLTLDELAQLPVHSLTATLDCTGGWYSEQVWTGVRVRDLLALAQVQSPGRVVRFRSITGYRWSLPLDEAMNALLATHVGDAPLSPGNGAPLRLVAAGRRGFQRVKGVVAVEVMDTPDMGQWAAIFTSGLDGA